MQDMKELKLNIEVLREKLNKLIINRDFRLGNKEIISVSQELDVLLENYVKIEKNQLIV